MDLTLLTDQGLTDQKFETYKRYENGAVVEPADSLLIDTFYSIGLARPILLAQDGEGNLVDVAILTARGKERLRMERIYRSPIRNCLHTLGALLE